MQPVGRGQGANKGDFSFDLRSFTSIVSVKLFDKHQTVYKVHFVNISQIQV